MTNFEIILYGIGAWVLLSTAGLAFFYGASRCEREIKRERRTGLRVI